MSTREALGYLVQLRDLYVLQFKTGKPAREYVRLPPPGV